MFRDLDKTDWKEIRWMVFWIAAFILVIMLLIYPFAKNLENDWYLADVMKVCRHMQHQNGRLTCVNRTN